MSTRSAFVKVFNTETITIEPRYLDKNIKKHLIAKPKNLEGKCTDFGWCKPGSVEIKKFDLEGTINMASLAGYTNHNIVYSADVFYPATGDTYECIVDKVTIHGLRAVYTYDSTFNGKPKTFTIMQVLVTRKMIHMHNEIDPVNFEVGDRISIKVVRGFPNKNDNMFDVVGTTIAGKPMFTLESTSINASNDESELSVINVPTIEMVDQTAFMAEDDGARYVDVQEEDEDDDEDENDDEEGEDEDDEEDNLAEDYDENEEAEFITGVDGDVPSSDSDSDGSTDSSQDEEDDILDENDVEMDEEDGPEDDI